MRATWPLRWRTHGKRAREPLYFAARVPIDSGMKAFGDAITRAGLAMAGRNSPWGGGKGNGDSGDGGDDNSSGDSPVVFP